MSRQLLIMRHAKSSWDHPNLSDFQRPLTNRGLKDAPRMGHWLQSAQVLPDHVVASPAQRARQTTELVCQVLGFSEDRIVWNHSVYNADLKDLLDVLSAVPADARITLLVGHNPGLEFLFTFLGGRASEGSADQELIKTATLTLITLPNDWSRLTPGCGAVMWIKHPKELAAAAQD
ncbi:MAG: histidine phosphatase family protein [Magnetococcales bacterium]|nr:histidine phosphatase family protein [Magnetococcales bacterium]